MDQTPINVKTKRQRQLPAPVERIAMVVEEQLLWRGADALRAAGGALRRLFEAIADPLRRWVAWPIQDRVPLLDGPGRMPALGAVLLLVVAAGLATVAFDGSDSEPGEPAAAPIAASASPVAEPEPTAAKPAATGPTLKGAAPVFEPARKGPAAGGGEKAAGKAGARAGSPQDSKSGSGSASAGRSESARGDPAATATLSSSPAAQSGDDSSPAAGAAADGPAAGPRALAVARRFAAAFVVYETGGSEAKVRRALAGTATPELARSLLRRPPRLPANVKVPKAKVVNVVAGPSSGGVYSVSVSLLRVGLTSELRLDMEKLKNRGWRVTNVLG